MKGSAASTWLLLLMRHPMTRRQRHCITREVQHTSVFPQHNASDAAQPVAGQRDGPEVSLLTAGPGCHNGENHPS